MHLRRLALLGTCLGLWLGTQPALANLSQPSPRIAVSGDFSAPVGFQLFCLQQPAHCRGGGSTEVRLTDAVWQKIVGVNSSVNRSIRPRGERGDVWSLNVREGDCEDYVLAKRAALISSGIPASALRIAIARTRQGVGHAVLVVRTTQGDFVLDNLTSEVDEWHRTSLRWVAMSGANPRNWQTIAG